MGKFRTISLPGDLYKQVEKKVKEGNYNTITEFVKEAIRLRLEAMNG